MSPNAPAAPAAPIGSQYARAHRNDARRAHGHGNAPALTHNSNAAAHTIAAAHSNSNAAHAITPAVALAVAHTATGHYWLSRISGGAGRYLARPGHTRRQ